jgi:hypothetical protein
MTSALNISVVGVEVASQPPGHRSNRQDSGAKHAPERDALQAQLTPGEDTDHEARDETACFADGSTSERTEQCEQKGRALNFKRVRLEWHLISGDNRFR